MLYFAYGSNMLIERMVKRVPSAEPLFVATLKEHDLRFHKVSKDGSGKADAFFTGNDSDFVMGVVYQISRQHKPDLDAFEGRPNHYEMKWVDVVDEDGNVFKVFTYVAQIIDATYIPFEFYKAMVVNGAIENGLPKTYIKKLKAVKAWSDARFLAALAVKKEQKNSSERSKSVTGKKTVKIRKKELC